MENQSLNHGTIGKGKERLAKKNPGESSETVKNTQEQRRCERVERFKLLCRRTHQENRQKIKTYVQNVLEEQKNDLQRNLVEDLLSYTNELEQALKETQDISETDFRQYFGFLLSLKLFLVMGISWTFEIASFAHGESHIIWKIMDTFNCLQGVVIFFLLVVLRRRAMKGLASERCCLPITRPLAEKLSPHDDLEDQQILDDDTAEVRLN